MKKASDLLPHITVDQSAQTIAEIQAESIMGRSWTERFVAGMVKDGKFEQVFKRVGPKLVRAYRPKK